MIQKKYLAPNGCTLSSLIVGLIAMQQVVNHQYIQACWLITLCMIFDLFDGKLARKFEAFSEFGAELDSLVDFLSFGVAPAFLAYNLLLIKKPLLGGILCIFYVICSVSRLARFNTNLTDLEVKQDFKGLPVPAAAALIVAYIIFSARFPHKGFATYLTAIILATSFMMISNIQFRPIKASGEKKIYGKIFVAIILIASIEYASYIYFPLCVVLLLKNFILNLGQKYQKSS